MRPFDLETIAADLPARALIPRLEQLDAAGPGLRVVVEAPPGTGKTTVVPPAVANLLALRAGSGRAGRVIVAEPRRIAARSAARRLAQLSGTELGREVGYTVRGERRTGRDTAVEFVTTGVLLRRLVHDPELAGVGCVVLDEVHERHLDSDLAFGMLRQLVDLRAEVEEPLGLVAMSATLDAGRWVGLLGTGSDPAPIASAEAVLHELTELWAPPPTRALTDRGVDRDFLAHVARTVREHAPEHADTLVFLPGQREIDEVAHRLGGSEDVHVLSGRTPAREQDRVLDPRNAGTGRIILATNVAESALTVPGVRLVVDAGLDRQQRLDTVRGMSGLVTVGASKAAMVQRAGRAAREAPGVVVRCLSSADFAARPAETPPEVRTADLTSAVLDLACWGAPGGIGLRLPDKLPERAHERARTVLRGLGAVDQEEHATDLGRRLARIPADPRLARGLLDGAELVGSRAAAEVVAALSSEQRAPGGDVARLLQGLRRDRDRRWIQDVDRYRREIGRGGEEGSGTASSNRSRDDGHGAGRRDDQRKDKQQGRGATEADVGLVTALAYPEAIARRRATNAGAGATPGAASGARRGARGGAGGARTAVGAGAPREEYLLASGTAAELPRDSGLAGQEWLAVAETGLHQGRALVRAAAVIDRETAELAGAELMVEEQTARFSGGKVSARAVSRLGAIQLSSTPVSPRPETTRQAVAEALAERGLLEFLRPNEGFEALRGRLGLLQRVYGGPWPDVSVAALEATAADWLGPELEKIAAGTPAARVDATSALRRLLPWPEAARMDDLVPERVAVPSGSGVRLDWPAPEDHGNDEDGEAIAPPVLAVKLQECFGWAQGPTVCEGRVPVQLHLLSPARRPLAVTQDLTSFWENAYPHVRAENRNKYKKHPWPEDPWNAVATAKTKNRMEGKG